MELFVLMEIWISVKQSIGKTRRNQIAVNLLTVYVLERVRTLVVLARIPDVVLRLWNGF